MEKETWKAIGTIVESIKTEINNIREKLSKSEDASVCLDNIETECRKLSVQVKEKTKKKPIRSSFQPHPPSYIPEWSNLMTARNAAHWRVIRNEGLANLYIEWSSFPTPKIPRKFKRPQMYSDSEEENVIYRDQAVKQMVAEAEIHVLRSSRNAEIVKKIDQELSEAVKRVRQSEIATMLNEMWTSSIKKAEEKNVSDWHAKKQWWARTVKPITDSEGKDGKHRAKQYNSSQHEQRHQHQHQQQQTPNRQRNPNSTHQRSSRPNNNRGRHNGSNFYHNHAGYERNNHIQQHRNSRYNGTTFNNKNNNNQYYADYADATRGYHRRHNDQNSDNTFEYGGRHRNTANRDGNMNGTGNGRHCDGSYNKNNRRFRYDNTQATNYDATAARGYNTDNYTYQSREGGNFQWDPTQYHQW